MFGDGIHDDLALIGHRIHFDLFGMFDELADNDRMLLRHVGRQLQKALEFLLVGADIHSGTAQHIARTD